MQKGKRALLGIALLVIVNNFSVYCQNNSTRALLIKELSQKANDSTRIPILRDICNNYRETDKNLINAIPYALELLKYRKQQGDKIKISTTEDFIGQAYLDKKEDSNALIYFLSSIKLKEEFKDFGDKYTLLLWNIGLIYFDRSELTNANLYFQKLIAACKQNNNKEYEVKGQLMLGRTYSRQGLWDNAEQSLDACLKLSQEMQSKADIAVALNNLATLYCQKDNFVKGLDYYFQSLKLGQEINDASLIVSNLNDLTIALESNRDYDAALTYLLEAKTNYGSNNLINATILGNIGVIKMSQEKHEEAITNINMALKLAENFPSKEIAADGLCNLGFIYTLQNKFTLALTSLQQSLKYSKAMKDEIRIARNLTNLGRVYLAMAIDSLKNNLPDSLKNQLPVSLLQHAKTYLKFAITICLRLNKQSLLQEDYLLLSKVQHYQQDNKAAIDSYQAYTLTRDSVYSNDKAKELNRLQLQYQFDKKAAEKEKQFELAKANTAYKVKLYTIIGLAVFFITILAFSLNRKIENGKYKLEIISLKQEALNAKMSDHFIGNTMDSINNFIKNNDRDKASEYLGRFRRLIRNVLENVPEKLVLLNDDLSVLRDYIELEALRFPNNSLQYKITVDNAIDLDKVLIPPMILQILAENSIKHGFKKSEGGRLLIKINKEDNVLEYTVEDNGIGRSATTFSSYGETTNHRSIGGGLAERLVQLAGSSRNSGKFKITDLLDESNNPIGTRVVFTLPYNMVN